VGGISERICPQYGDHQRELQIDLCLKTDGEDLQQKVSVERCHVHVRPQGNTTASSSVVLRQCIEPAFTKVSTLPQRSGLSCSHNVGPIEGLAAILQTEAPVVVLQVVVVQMVHSGDGALWLEVLLQHQVGSCGHGTSGMAVCGGRTDTPAGGGLLAGRFAVVWCLLHFALHRRAHTIGCRCGFTLLCLILRFGFLLRLLAPFPLHPAILEPDLDLKAKLLYVS